MKILKYLAVVTSLFFITPVVADTEIKWETDFEVAKQRAKQEGKKIVMIFEGSEWCIYCKRMEKNIWGKEEFQSKAKNNFVFLRLDFPKNFRSKSWNKEIETLLKKYNPEEKFPTIVLFDKNGNWLGKDGYRKMLPEKYIDHLNNIKLLQ